MFQSLGSCLTQVPHVILFSLDSLISGKKGRNHLGERIPQQSSSNMNRMGTDVRAQVMIDSMNPNILYDTPLWILQCTFLIAKGGSRGVSKVSRNWSDHLWLVFAYISLIMSMLPYSYTFMCWKPVIKVFRFALE